MNLIIFLIRLTLQPEGSLKKMSGSFFFVNRKYDGYSAKIVSYFVENEMFGISY